MTIQGHLTTYRYFLKASKRPVSAGFGTLASPWPGEVGSPWKRERAEGPRPRF